MSKGRSSNRTTANTPKRRAAGRIATMAGALDDVQDAATRDAGRRELEARAAAMGLTLHSFEVTHQPIPDPAVDALPEKEQARIEAITRRMYDDPGALCDELVELVARYPHIPMLRNHLAGALNARGEHDRADALIEETTRLFPEYVFGFANHVMTLLADGKIAAAGALLEEGPRGPLLFIGAFVPHRTVFHSTEIVCYAGMTGHYFLATDRLDAAKVSLKMMRTALPEHPQTKHLAQKIRLMEVVSKARDSLASLSARRRKPSSGKLNGNRRRRSEF